MDALGTNDVENLTQQISALPAMYDAFDDAGIKVIVCSIPPNTAKVANVQRLNRWKRAIAKLLGNLFVDNYAALVDPAAGTMLAAFDSDGTHFNTARGASRWHELRQHHHRHLGPTLPNWRLPSQRWPT